MATSPTTTYSISQDAQRQILTDVRRAWANTQYQTEVELKIQDRLRSVLGRDVGETQKSLTERLREIEVAIGLLDEELGKLEPEA
ncbi:MAG: hypothetical protein WCI67_15955 [Chloroflexales bacterium]